MIEQLMNQIISQESLQLLLKQLLLQSNQQDTMSLQQIAQFLLSSTNWQQLLHNLKQSIKQKFLVRTQQAFNYLKTNFQSIGQLTRFVQIMNQKQFIDQQFSHLLSIISSCKSQHQLQQFIRQLFNKQEDVMLIAQIRRLKFGPNKTQKMLIDYLKQICIENQILQKRQAGLIQAILRNSYRIRQILQQNFNCKKTQKYLKQIDLIIKSKGNHFILEITKIFLFDPQQIQQVQRLIMQMTDEDKLRKSLKDQFGKKKSNDIIQHLKKLNYFTKKVDPKTKLFESLKQLNLTQQNYEKLIKLINQNKHQQLQEFLKYYIGQINYRLYYEQCLPFMKENQIIIVKGSYLLQMDLYQRNIYMYPKLQNKDLNNNTNKKILIIGETGSGKSSFINSLVNYVAGVGFYDKYRYKLIREQSNQSTKSNTREINHYILQFEDKYNLELIDTPGLADTQGVQTDMQNIQKIKKLLIQKEKWIHAVCFVVKYSSNRQKLQSLYIFQSLFEIFGKDIAKNFIFVLTHFDLAEKSQSQFLIQRMFTTQNLNKIQGQKFIKINNSSYFEGQHMKNLWIKSQESFKTMINKISNLQPSQLQQCKEIVKKKQLIENLLKNIFSQFNNQLLQQTTIQKQIKTICSFQKQIIKNQNFSYLASQIIFKKIKVQKPSVNCRSCNRTCKFKSSQDLPNQNIFIQNKCTICYCFVTKHCAENYIIEAVTHNVIKTKKDIFQKWKQIIDKKQIYQKILFDLLRKIYESIQKAIKSVVKINELNKQINEICLVQTSQRTTILFLKNCINKQIKERSAQYQKRIQTIQRMIKILQVKEQIENVSLGVEDLQKQIKKQKIQQLMKIIEVQDQQVKQRLFNTISFNLN